MRFDQPSKGAAGRRMTAISAAIKRKQALVAGLGLVGAGVVLIGAVAFMRAGKSSAPPAPPEKPVTLNLAPAGAAVDPKDAWRGQEGTRIDRLEKAISDLDEQMKRDKAEQARSQPAFPPGLPAGPQTAMLPPPPPPPAARTALPAPLPPMTQAPGHPGGPGMNSSGPAGQMPPPEPAGIESGVMGDAPAARGAGQEGAKDDRKEGKPARTSSTYLPSGSFIRAVLLAGLNAPTGGQAQSNPHPVLLRLVDHAQLPNQFRLKARDCLVVGSGWGDLSSERAFIRLESMSCISPAGEALDMPLKGYVAGEDGKFGVMGRLVTKQGQVLANALIAGIGSGLGRAFQQSSMTTSTSALGSTSTVKDGKELQAGLYSGVGQAMDRLAQYYITLAEKLYPVIEVDAGRLVDVVITKGASLPMGEATDQESTTSTRRYGAR